MSGGQAPSTEDDDIDLTTLMKLMDSALASDNPAVKEQLRKLLMIAALTTSNDPRKVIQGPLSSMMEKVLRLQHRMTQLEDLVHAKQSGAGIASKSMSPGVYVTERDLSARSELIKSIADTTPNSIGELLRKKKNE